MLMAIPHHQKPRRPGGSQHNPPSSPNPSNRSCTDIATPDRDGIVEHHSSHSMDVSASRYAGREVSAYTSSSNVNDCSSYMNGNIVESVQVRLYWRFVSSECADDN